MHNNSERHDSVRARTRVPRATYRLQFNRSFDFSQATGILDYLRDLGVGDVYASPLFQAGPDSTHGYDICSFEHFSHELGGNQGFAEFSRQLRQFGLGLLLDMVPNHMGSAPSNLWWNHVLEHGPASPFAPSFDIDWKPRHVDWQDKVLLPVLEDYYARVLEEGKLQLQFVDGRFVIAYHERHFPVAPHSVARLLEAAAGELGLDSDLAQALRELARTSQDARVTYDGSRPSPSLLERLKKSGVNGDGLEKVVRALCARYNGRPNEPHSFDELDRLLKEQHYRLASWRTGPEEINYRRFLTSRSLSRSAWNGRRFL